MPITFSDLAIKKLPEGLHFDTRLPSFAIRIGKNRKTWLVIKGDNRTKVRLGHYPTLSLADARKRALVALGSPFEPQTAPTFPEALKSFLAQDKWRPYSKYVLENSLSRFTWSRPIHKISHEDVAQALEAIQAPSARAHALKDLRTFFNWCIPRYLKASPCVGLKMPAYKSRDRVLTEDELRRVWIACEYMPEPFGKIVRLLILTGQRKGEIGALTWDYVKDNKILLPKTLTKNGREHEFPVGKMTMQVINSVPVGRGATYLFQGRNGQYNGWGKHFKELLKRSGTTGWTLHDLRRTFATNLAALNVPIHVTEKLLNHVSGALGGIAGVYNRHSYWTEQVEAIQLWEKRLQEIAR